MNVIFYSIRHYGYSSAFETELEIILNHMRKGDSVTLLTCNDALKSCSINSKKMPNICLLCQSRFHMGLKKINFPLKHVKSIIEKPYFLKVPNGIYSSLEELKKFEIEEIDLGMAVASSIVTELRDHRFDIGVNRDLVTAKLQMAYSVYRNFLNHIETIKPDLVYVTNGRYAEDRPVVRICQKKSIKFISVEKACSVGKYNLFLNNLPHEIDYLHKEIRDLWGSGGKEKEKVAKKWFLDKRNGNRLPRFTQNQTRGLLPAKFNFKKTNVAIFTSSIDEYEGIQGWENPLYKDETEGIKKIALSLLKNKRMMFYVRVHPNLAMRKNNAQIEDLKKIEKMNMGNVKIIWSDEKIDSYALITNCEKVVSFGSTIGLESCFWRKPSILIGRSNYEKLDCCYIPASHNELIKILQIKLKPKKVKDALQFAYREVSNGMPLIYFKYLDPVEGKFSHGKKHVLVYRFLNNTLCLEGTFMGEPIFPHPSIIEKLKLIFLFLSNKNVYKAIYKKLKKHVVGKN